MIKDIYFYSNIQSWLNESPDATIKGTIISKSSGFIEIQDENGYTQIINLDKLYAIVY